jgi:nucleoside-diphosphate-sugar epimerase
MTATPNRKRKSFAKKAKRMKVNLEATEEVARAARRLLAQVAWIVLILFTVAGVFFPDLLPIVAHAISLLGTKIV